jgi:hypothetical protein
MKAVVSFVILIIQDTCQSMKWISVKALGFHIDSHIKSRHGTTVIALRHADFSEEVVTKDNIIVTLAREDKGKL